MAWSIKGYHVDWLKPPAEVTLDLQREPQNRFGRHAVIVNIPRLYDMPQHVQALQCDTRGGIRPLGEMAGRTLVRPCASQPVSSFYNTRGQGIAAGAHNW